MVTLMVIHTPGRYFQKPGIWTRVFGNMSRFPCMILVLARQDHEGKIKFIVEIFFNQNYVQDLGHVTQNMRSYPSILEKGALECELPLLSPFCPLELGPSKIWPMTLAISSFSRIKF